jgi:uncharacterized protein YhdP
MQKTPREGASPAELAHPPVVQMAKVTHARERGAVSLRIWTFGVRCVFWATLLVVALFLAAIAVTRFWLVPNADQFRPRVVAALAAATQQRVVIGGFNAGWNGWSPELTVTRLQILDDRGRTLLELPEVETTLSWRSLLAFEPRLSSLTVRKPRVVVRRTAENRLTIAGIDVTLDEPASKDDPAALEWLLRQRFVQIEGGEFEWHDEWRGLAALRMRDVHIRLANDGAQHRIGMRATPAAEIASPFEFRAQIAGAKVREISDWEGSAYLRVDYANLASLSRYLPLPIDIARGDGGMQAWFEFEGGRPLSVTTDLVVRDARVAVRPQTTTAARSNTTSPSANAAVPPNAAAPPIAFSELAGRFSWREISARNANSDTASAAQGAASAQRWSLRDVTVETLAREKLPALSGELTIQRSDSTIVGGEFRSAKIDLASAQSLSSVIAPLLPSVVLDQVRASAPRGSLTGVQASWKTPASDRLNYQVTATGSDLSWIRTAVPGVSGLSGQLQATQDGGEFLFAGAAASENAGSAAKRAIAKVGSVFSSADSKKSVEKGTESAPSKRSVKLPLSVDLGDMFPEPLQLGTVAGRVNWKRTPLGAAGNTPPAASAAPVPGRTNALGAYQLQVSTNGIEVDNERFKGRFAGTWQSDELGPGVAKISGKLDRADAKAVHQYLPRGVGDGAKRWVKNAIVDGRIVDASFAVEGSLWHFPFEDAKFGKFEIIAPVRDVVVDYADDWPAAKQVDALLTFRGVSFNAAVDRAIIAGANIGKTQVKIADMGSVGAAVEIRGTASSTLDNFLRFVESSPVNDMIGRFTVGAKGTGASTLALGLDIPIKQPDRTKVDGEFVFQGNRVELSGDVPVLENVTGRLVFTEKELAAKELRATTLGGSTAISVLTEAGVIKASASGRSELAKLRETFDYPLLDQLSGALDWRLSLQTGAAPSVQINGVLSPQALPIDGVYQAASAPRDIRQPINFSLVRSTLALGRDRIEFEIPTQLHAILERGAERPGEARLVERAVVDFGAQKTALPARGYSLRGEIAKLDTDAALALLPSLTARNSRNVGGIKTESTTPDFVNMNLRVERAVIFSHVLTDVSLRAQPSGQRWRLAIRSKEATGVIAIENESESGNIDAVSVRLQRFSFPAAATPSDRIAYDLAADRRAVANTATPEAITRWPKLDLVAESFVSETRDMGRLEIKAQPGTNEWRIETVKLVNADGSLTASGQWQQPLRATGAAIGQTTVDVALAWKDAGRFMQRFGLPKGVERAEGELTGKLSWEGSPAQFAYPKLNGSFTLKTKAGRFTEMEPGIAKLLGVISLQSVPRRLTFNFDDLFGRGFAFDSVASDVSIVTGKAATDSFSIVGPAARVEIRGDADLIAETANLRVRVFPSLSVAAAIGIGLATANPAIGAAAWLGQKIAKDPVERLLMQEFDVTGPWAAPEVVQTRGMGAGGREDAQAADLATPPTGNSAPSPPVLPNSPAAPSSANPAQAPVETARPK